MEKLMRPYDMELMKMAMLKHEETFKQQVCELHRLYRIQKILMKSIDHSSRGNRDNQERWDSPNHSQIHQKPQLGLDLEQQGEDYIQESDREREIGIEDEGDIELTLGPSSYYWRKKAETPPSSVSRPSFSSSSSGSSHMKRTISGIQSARRNSFGVDEELRQGRLKQHPWILQALSLNMT